MFSGGRGAKLVDVDGNESAAATGSAAGALGAWLVRHGLVRNGGRDPVRLVIEQGYEMGRPSSIHVEVEREGGQPSLVRVGGQAVEVAEGVLRIPD